MEANTQRMRLIVNGAVNIYEGPGLEIVQILKQQQRDDLVSVLDNIAAALYWLQEELPALQS